MSVIEDQLRTLRYQEWLEERKLMATLVLGGSFLTNGWGKPAGFRVLGYSKSFDRAIEIGLKQIAEKSSDLELKSQAFYARLTLELWQPPGPKDIGKIGGVMSEIWERGEHPAQAEVHEPLEEDEHWGKATEAHIEAVAKLYQAMDIVHEHGLNFDEILDSARQSWRP